MVDSLGHELKRLLVAEPWAKWPMELAFTFAAPSFQLVRSMVNARLQASGSSASTPAGHSWSWPKHRSVRHMTQTVRVLLRHCPAGSAWRTSLADRRARTIRARLQPDEPGGSGNRAQGRAWPQEARSVLLYGTWIHKRPSNFWGLRRQAILGPHGPEIRVW